MPRLTYNGPAIWGGCVTRRRTGQSPGTLAPPAGGSRCKEGMACFLPSWYEFYCILAQSRYKLDRSREFIPGYKIGGGHWPRLRRGYNLSRNQKIVMVQDLYWGQMSVSGRKNHYKFVLRVGAKAKSMTNNLPILSVLGIGCY